MRLENATCGQNWKLAKKYPTGRKFFENTPPGNFGHSRCLHMGNSLASQPTEPQPMGSQPIQYASLG